MISMNTSVNRIPITLNFYDDCIGVQQIKMFEKTNETKWSYRVFSGVSFEEKMSGDGIFKLIGANGINAFEVNNRYRIIARQAREFVKKKISG